jgi:hypothetical protein
MLVEQKDDGDEQAATESPINARLIDAAARYLEGSIPRWFREFKCLAYQVPDAVLRNRRYESTT